MTAPGAELDDITNRLKGIYQRALDAARRAANDRSVRERALHGSRTQKPVPATDTAPAHPPQEPSTEPDRAGEIARAAAYAGAAAGAAENAREWAHSADGAEKDQAQNYADRADIHVTAWEDRLTELGVDVELLKAGTDPSSAENAAQTPADGLADDEPSIWDERALDSVASDTFDVAAADAGADPTIAELLDAAAASDVAGGALAPPPEGALSEYTSELDLGAGEEQGL